jgi:hypothetical protein
MNIPGYVVKIVAGALLLASVPAGAQILGGGAAGGLNGALGGGLGAQGLGAAGGAGAWGRGGIDGAGTFDAARDRTQQLGARTHEAARKAGGATRSGAQAAHGRTAASAEAAQSAGASAARSAEPQAPAVPAAPATGAQPGSGLVLQGGGSAGAEKQAFGHDVSALGSADSQGSADRSGVHYNGNGKADVGVKKHEPAPATEAAQ